MKKSVKKSGIVEEYKKSFNYIRESRNYIYYVVLIFLIFGILGYFIQLPDAISEQLLRSIQELVERTQGLSQTELISFIFFNNLQASFLGILLGIFLGIFPLIATVFNGFLVGFVGKIAVSEGGVIVLWRLLPHGIFELPAIFISFGLGLKSGTFLFRKNKMESFKEYFWNSLRVFIFVVVPLLIIAAIIEGSLIAIGA